MHFSMAMALPAFWLALAAMLERFQAKWIPLRVKKTRQNRKLEPVPIPSERGEAVARRGRTAHAKFLKFRQRFSR
jgi:hypothetical protein